MNSGPSLFPSIDFVGRTLALVGMLAATAHCRRGHIGHPHG